MVQFRILSGKQAGATWVARRFPVRIGRSFQVDFRAEEDGVWDQHLVIDFRPGHGFLLTPASNALVAVNSEPVPEALLRNGDVIDLGSLKLQFWLAESRQGNLHLREVFTWAVVGLVGLAQIGLLYWLLD